MSADRFTGVVDVISVVYPCVEVREIFSQVDTLKKYRLDVPQVTILADELKKRGLEIPDGILRKEELVEALCRLN